MGEQSRPGPHGPAVGVPDSDASGGRVASTPASPVGVMRPPAGRYRQGRDARHGRRRRVITLSVLFAAFTAVVVWLGYLYATPGVSSQLTGYVLGGDGRSVTVQFTVHKPKDKAASCVVEATDRDHNQVGRTEVRIGPGAADARMSVLLRTTAKPDNGQLGDCSLDS